MTPPDEILISDKTPNELCPDCEANGAFLVRCFVGAHSWVCETCYRVRLEREHGKQAFWERIVEAEILAPARNTGINVDELASFADAVTDLWALRFGRAK